MTTLAALAVATTRIELGTAIANIYLRHPYELAGACVAVDELSEGRLTLGLGVSHHDLNIDWLGLTMEKPLSRMRVYLRVVRASLDAPREPIDVTTDRYRVNGAKFVWTTPRRVPIILAALQDGMVRLAADEADGVVLSLPTLQQIARTRATLDGAGRGKTIAPVLFMCERPTRAAAREVMRGTLTPYFKRPFYRAQMAAAGIPWVSVPASDAIVDALTLAGPRDYLREQLALRREAGLDLALIAPCFGETDKDAGYLGVAGLA